MNRFRILTILAAIAVLAGCDKAGSWLEKGGLAGLPENSGKPGGDVDAALAVQVQRSETGVRFRRDIPFPPSIQGKLTISRDYDNVLKVETSELGKTSERLGYTAETEVGFDKQSGEFEIRLTKADHRVLEEDDEEEIVKLPGAGEEENRSTKFVLTDEGWVGERRSGNSDFKSMAWSDTLIDSVPQLMVETGAHPRVQWFSSSRYWSAGDRVVLTGNAIKMLNPFKVSGRVILVFEGEEAVAGHPCGVFSVTGNLSLEGQTKLDGVQRDAEISIHEGKIWASLLHPIILREEYSTVQTVTRSGHGPVTKLQGNIAVTKARAWIPEGS